MCVHCIHSCKHRTTGERLDTVCWCVSWRYLNTVCVCVGCCYRPLHLHTHTNQNTSQVLLLKLILHTHGVWDPQLHTHTHQVSERITVCYSYEPCSSSSSSLLAATSFLQLAASGQNFGARAQVDDTTRPHLSAAGGQVSHRPGEHTKTDKLWSDLLTVVCWRLRSSSSSSTDRSPTHSPPGSGRRGSGRSDTASKPEAATGRRLHCPPSDALVSAVRVGFSRPPPGLLRLLRLLVLALPREILLAPNHHADVQNYLWPRQRHTQLRLFFPNMESRTLKALNPLNNDNSDNSDTTCVTTCAHI